jgi:HupE / UreJ protein
VSLRRAVALLAGVAILVLAAPAFQASAHPLSTTAVLLDVNAHHVDATIDLPLDELSVAMDQKLSTTNVLEATTLADLRTYVQAHMSATDTTRQAWTSAVTGGVVKKVDGIDNLVLDATLTPSSGDVGDFVLHYDAIIDKLVAHRVFVAARYGSSGSYTTLAMLSWQTTSVPVASTTPPASQGFVAAAHLGVQHISGGSDHLLFLIMLLLPAPLLARGRRWVRRDDPGRAAWRVVHVVTAFAIGQSITLALGALGWVHLPTRLVECGIALSVLVSALHAIRPLARRGEVFIAGSFGLLHGLAFATLLTEMDLSRRGLVTTLLGFNLGIEITQLSVVALVMPSLILLIRTAAYPALRVTLAGTGSVLATAWLAERSEIISTNPLEPVGAALVQHPFSLAAALAAAAVISVLLQHLGRDAVSSSGRGAPTST